MPLLLVHTFIYSQLVEHEKLFLSIHLKRKLRKRKLKRRWPTGLPFHSCPLYYSMCIQVFFIIRWFYSAFSFRIELVIFMTFNYNQTPGSFDKKHWTGDVFWKTYKKYQKIEIILKKLKIDFRFLGWKNK